MIYRYMVKIREGTYGCIYYPSVPCGKSKAHEKDEKYITKIQKESESLKIELRISNIIKSRIASYPYYYAPIEETCDIDLNRIDKDNQCTKIPVGKKKIISYKVKYIGTKTWETKWKEWYKTLNKKQFVLKFIDSVTFILFSINQLLEKAQVIHNDTKDNNIMYDEINDCPIIIDFGLSMEIKPKGEWDTTTFFEKVFWLYSFDNYILGTLKKFKDTEPVQNVSSTNSRTVQFSNESHFLVPASKGSPRAGRNDSGLPSQALGGFATSSTQLLQDDLFSNKLVEFTESNAIFGGGKDDDASYIVFDEEEKLIFRNHYKTKIDTWIKDSSNNNLDKMSHIFTTTHQTWDLYSLMVAIVVMINKHEFKNNNKPDKKEINDFLLEMKSFCKNQIMKIASGTATIQSCKRDLENLL